MRRTGLEPGQETREHWGYSSQPDGRGQLPTSGLTSWVCGCLSVIAAAGIRLGSFSWGGLFSGCRFHVCCRSIGGHLGYLPILSAGVELL